MIGRLSQIVQSVMFRLCQVAAMRGQSPEALAALTRRNALSFYGLESDER